MTNQTTTKQGQRDNRSSAFTPLLPSKKTFLSNSRWQKHNERQKRSTKNENMAEIAKCPVSNGVTEGGSL